MFNIHYYWPELQKNTNFKTGKGKHGQGEAPRPHMARIAFFIAHQV